MPISQDHAERRVLDIVTGLVHELRGAPPRSVTLQDGLERDLGIGSLERVELLLRVQRQLGVRLPDAVMAEAERVGDIVDALVAGSGGAAVEEDRSRRQPAIGRGAGTPEAARTLVDVLRWHAERTPERRHILLREQDGQERPITYAQLWDRAGEMAAALAERGVGPGDHVALMLRTEPAFFSTFFGTLLAGAVPVPIYPPFRADRIEEFAQRQAAILRNAEARLLVTFSEAARLGGLLRAEVPRLEAVIAVNALAAPAGRPPARTRDAADTALIQYTSGSTGAPKGVVLSHQNLLANIRAIGVAVAINPDDVVVSWLPLYHDMGLIGTWLGALYFGVPLVLMSPLAFLARPSRWLWAFHTYRGTLSPAPNFAYELCVTKVDDREIEGLDLSSWRAALNGAEPVSPDTIERFTRRYAACGFRPEALCPVYGMAECSVALTASPLGRLPRIDRIDREIFQRHRRAEPAGPQASNPLLFVACGRPIPDHEIRIVDARGRPAPERSEGRVEFRGPSVMQGYFRNPGATAAIQDDDWLISGDLGYVADGELFITGREKDLIIVGGRNVYPHEVEEVAGNVPGIRRGCVAAFGLADPAAGTERLVVVAETRETEAARREELRAAVADAVAAAVGLPAHTVVLAGPGAVLKTSSGKIRRGATRDACLAGRLGRGRRGLVLQWGRLLLTDIGGRVRRGLAWLVDALYTVYVGVFAALTLIPLWGLLLVLPVGRTADRLVRGWARLAVAATGCRLDVRGAEHLAMTGPVIFLANHASYIDVVIAMAAIRRPFRFVAKRGLLRYPLVGAAIRKMGCLTIERADVSRLLEGADEVVDALRRGESLFVFPEGTFTAARGLLPFRLGAFRAAVAAGRSLVPVALCGTREMLPAGRMRLRRTPIAVAIGPPLTPSGDGWPEMVRLRDEARARIEAMLSSECR